MNKPLSLLGTGMSGLGMLILAVSGYFALVYGRGDLEAGNFHRCIYRLERDAWTGEVRREWETDWGLVSSTEGSPLAATVDMWALGTGLVVLGLGLRIAGATEQRQRSAVTR